MHKIFWSYHKYLPYEFFEGGIFGVYRTYYAAKSESRLPASAHTRMWRYHLKFAIVARPQ